jgi:hypothetical protein
MRFTYNDLDIGGNEANYVPGRVLDQSPFTRSTDGGTNDVDRANNRAVFNGPSTGATFPGAGFALDADANYTAGAEGRFSGTPTVYYSRNDAMALVVTMRTLPLTLMTRPEHRDGTIQILGPQTLHLPTMDQRRAPCQVQAIL